MWTRFLLLGVLGVVAVVQAGMEVDLYVHKDKFGKSLTLEVGDKECTNVPRLWANLTQSVDTHGSCMQFYDRANCKGRIAVIQPFHTVHQMDLTLIQFHNTIESVSTCGAKVPSGRYVIQSAVDASMLTVQKHENEFAKVNTLPPQAFIPKAQQWEISEKQANEYDIMPRIHETNTPITYDAEAMKKGSFIRKVWKIESVGRGRYVIKSDWTQKCLYKTRVRTVEEHDCRAWSPNQEWVLRPLIAPTKPPPTAAPHVNTGINYQVPSRVVEKYLDEQKRLKDKEFLEKNKNKAQSDHAGAFLEPYRIRKNKPKKNHEEDSEEEDEGKLRQGFPQLAPPGPEIMYSRPAPIFKYEAGRPLGRHPGKVVSYMEGISPIFEDEKVEDPSFPDFLLHHTNDDDEGRDEGMPPRYQVTRRPFTPEPVGHPDYIPDKKKYDGRIKNFKKQEVVVRKEDEESQEDSKEEEEEDNNEEDADEENAQPGHFGYDGTVKVRKPEVESKKEKEVPEGEDSQEGEEESQESNKADEENKQEVEEDISPEAIDDIVISEDPGGNIAGFMKLLLQGVSNRINKPSKKPTEMELLSKKKK